ncbi:MAG: hypothetical protein AAF632_18680 [Bacteroidota bacterium]
MRALVIIFSVCVFVIPSRAQFIVIDPGDIAATIVNGGILVKTNQVIKDANELAQNISNTVHNIRELQYNIDQALYNVKALIQGDALGISNIAFEMDATARIETNIGAYMNGLLPGEHDMVVGYGNVNVSLGADLLQQVFEYGIDESLPALEQLISGQAEKVVNREIYEYASARKKIEIALTYNQLAEVMITKATQLNEILRRGINTGNSPEETLKMNEAERIRLFETSASYVRKSLDLKLQCDQLIKQEVSRARPLQEKVIQIYSQFQRMDAVLAGSN